MWITDVRLELLSSEDVCVACRFKMANKGFLLCSGWEAGNNNPSLVRHIQCSLND